MVTSRLISILVCSAIAISSGCGSQQKQPAVSESNPKPQDAKQSPPTNPDADVTLEPTFNAPDALARKTAEHSQQVQTAIHQDPQKTGATPTSRTPVGNPGGASLGTPPLQQSRVQWPDPGNQRSTVDVQKSTQPPLDFGKVPPPSDSAPPAMLQSSHGAANTSSNPTDNAEVAANTAAVTPQRTPVSAAGLNVGDSIGNSTELGPKITRKVKEYPRDVSGHLDFQLLRFLMDDRVPDQGALLPLPTEDRELMNTVIDGLVNFRSALRQDNNMLLSKKVKPLLEMSDRLRSQADLSVPTIALCTKVRTFGEYDPIDPPRFLAGKNHDVVLYCEVDNFSSQLDSNQLWQTKLTHEAVLYSEQGLPVWADKNQQITDSSRRRRHDFFIVKLLKLPENIAIGRYLLKVTIVDQQVNRIAEATIPIVIAAQ